MFLKPDYNLKSLYEIDLDELKSQGVTAMLFDLDSTLMASKAGRYSSEVLAWLDVVRRDFFIGVVSNNNNSQYEARVIEASDFPVLFDAKKPDTQRALKFMEKYGLKCTTTVLVGDRPLSDIWCGKNLGCRTILVDSITAKTENFIVRLARKVERLTIKK